MADPQITGKIRRGKRYTDDSPRAFIPAFENGTVILYIYSGVRTNMTRTLYVYINTRTVSGYDDLMNQSFDTNEINTVCIDIRLY